MEEPYSLFADPVVADATSATFCAVRELWQARMLAGVGRVASGDRRETERKKKSAAILWSGREKREDGRPPPLILSAVQVFLAVADSSCRVFVCWFRFLRHSSNSVSNRFWRSSLNWRNSSSNCWFCRWRQFL